MNNERTGSPLRANTRSQPRTVDTGRPSRAAIGRCPAPAALARNATPITSTPSARRSRHDTASSTCVTRHEPHRAYHRRGAVAYLAAYDVHRAGVHGRCEDTTGIVPFAALVEQVMTQEPYKSADRVFWVVDNGSSHRGQAAIDRLTEQFPNAIMVHTPVHASWLNQVEIFFSIVQRKVLSPNDFDDLDVVVERLAAFETRYNQAAKPFKWKFTTTDLADLLDRLDRHRPEISTDPAQPRAA